MAGASVSAEIEGATVRVAAIIFAADSDPEWEAAGWATILPLDPEAIAGWCEVAAAWGAVRETESCEACDHAS